MSYNFSSNLIFIIYYLFYIYLNQIKNDISSWQKIISYIIEKEIGIEIIGDAKVKISAIDEEDEYEEIVDEVSAKEEEEAMEQIDEEVNEEYIEEN